MNLRRAAYAVVLAALVPSSACGGVADADTAPGPAGSPATSAASAPTSGVVVDPPHDSRKFRGPMDVSRVRIDNGAHRLTMVIHLNRALVGDDIGISLRPPGGPARFGVFSVLRRHGRVRSGVESRQSPQPTCPGLVVDWAVPVIRVEVPSRCLANGHYGALRFNLLTEDGQDSDDVPDNTGSLGNRQVYSRPFARAGR